MVRDPAFVSFSKKAGVVLAMLVALIAVMTFAWPWMPWTIVTRVSAVEDKQTKTDRAVEQIRDILTIQATLMSEVPGSPDYEAARNKLRLMREVRFNPERVR